jgi:hypothetical protein
MRAFDFSEPVTDGGLTRMLELTGSAIDPFVA